jgi:hypothetical protein
MPLSSKLVRMFAMTAKMSTLFADVCALCRYFKIMEMRSLVYKSLYTTVFLPPFLMHTQRLKHQNKGRKG